MLENQSIVKNENSEQEERIIFHHLFRMSEEEKEKLRTRILGGNGIVRIMIHPYYIQHSTEPYITKDRRDQVVTTVFKRMLGVKSDVPIFLFEVNEEISLTKGRISSILKKAGSEIYIVPTYDGAPTPYVSTDSITVESKWHVFIELAKNLGIKKFIVGGMYLFLDEIKGSKEDTQKLNGCVGDAVNVLSADFDIQVSSIAHPQSRKDIIYPELKDIKNL